MGGKKQIEAQKRSGKEMSAIIESASISDSDKGAWSGSRIKRI